jgi:hypothetical protein
VLTPLQAKTESRFHFYDAKPECENWRRSGQTQTWKTRPNEFRVPIKFGLRESSALTESNLEYFHLESECPFRKFIICKRTDL